MNIQDVIDAIRKDGLPKIKGYYYRVDNEVAKQYLTNTKRGNEKVVGGCAFGQAAFNLGVEAEKLDIAVGTYTNGINRTIRRLNDQTDMTLPEIADFLEKNLTQEDREKKIYL